VQELLVRSFAKVNWFLHIGRRREDGFHELETLFQTVSLHDRLRFTASDRFSLTCSDPSIPTDESNLIARAFRAIASEVEQLPAVAIDVVKRIPAGGGLGGGSSNAAVTLLALRRMFELDISDERLRAIAASLGSDVPFFLTGGTAYATGRGERLTPLPDIRQQAILLLFPGRPVSTPEAYGRLAAERQAGRYVPAPLHGIEATRRALADPPADWWRNDLEPPVVAMDPVIAEWKEELGALGAGFALMSGSGSTLFALFADEARAHEAARVLTGRIDTSVVRTITAAESLSDLS
jgi:4-diphosphocytidyl-2-C-methyl-D-erythritol kinase